MNQVLMYPRITNLIVDKGTFFDHGSISRRNGIEPASKQLKIYFINGYFEEGDSGDFVTANSYGDFDYIKEIRSIDGVRNTDILDVRPSATPLR